MYMHRGIRSIHQSLFDEPTTLVADAPTPERKGRSEILKQKQYELIICRYYYHVKMHDKNYPTTLKILEEEVYLAQRTLVNIMLLDESRLQLKELQTKKPEVKYFRLKFPHFGWL